MVSVDYYKIGTHLKLKHCLWIDILIKWIDNFVVGPTVTKIKPTFFNVENQVDDLVKPIDKANCSWGLKIWFSGHIRL